MADLSPPRFARQRHREALTRFEAWATTSRSFSVQAWDRQGVHEHPCSMQSAKNLEPEVSDQRARGQRRPGQRR
jgi:hypothetical protein